MLDVPSISAVVAGAGVLVGVALAYLEVRNLVEARQTDLVTRLYSTYGSRDFRKLREKGEFLPLRTSSCRARLELRYKLC